MVVGEGPGETEDKLGRPFVGRAGELLDRMLLAIGLPREDVFICNTVKCRPTLDTGNRLANRAPTPDEMRNCRPYLDQQIEIIRPRVILALGAPAAKSFMGETFSITKQRGQWFDGPLRHADHGHLPPGVHPAADRRRDDRGQEAWSGTTSRRSARGSTSRAPSRWSRSSTRSTSNVANSTSPINLIFRSETIS